MNHCILEVEVIDAPTIRYTKDNQTAIAEMQVKFKPLRADDQPGVLKVVGWGNLAQDIQNRVQIGQILIIEGRLRMNSVPRQDGTKEKQAEFTLSKINDVSSSQTEYSAQGREIAKDKDLEETNWNTAPLIPGSDEIPF